MIPPETEPAAAVRLVAAAAIPGSVLTADMLMANETAISSGIRDARNREDTWDTEGGACMSSFGHPIGRQALPAPGNTRQ
ncbi:hypothetical protein ACIOMQ_32035 [Streptomyces sp. NPDC087845]|uniref:hypothetical protein n=1 Tax=Streptomyces sp. NPDC087845 TaxID=3365806 RepID=UPI003825DB54